MERTGTTISPKTLRNEHGLLSTVCEHAIRRRWITHNPAKGIRLPKVKRKKVNALTMESFVKIINAMPPQYRGLVYVLGTTGMRWGEVTALQWRDIDSTANTITIERAWKHGVKGKKRELGTPKTDRAYRTIETMPAVIDAMGERRGETDFVFTTTRGTPVGYDSFHRHYWQKTMRDLKLSPAPTIHELRHFAASHMLRGGAAPIEVSRMLGHESIQTTYDIYGHLIPTVSHPTVKLAMQVGEALSPSRGISAA